MAKELPAPQADPIDVERELAQAERKFSQILRGASKLGNFGEFGVIVHLKAGRVVVMRVRWDETLKPIDEET